MKINSIHNKKNLMSKHYYLLLLALLLFHIINNFIIITNDNTPLLWDGGDYFLKSLKYYDVFTNFGSDFISRFNAVSTYRPPLFMLSSLPLYLVFGRSTDVAIMTNILYLIILVLSVYGIGRWLRNKEVGLMSAFIVSVFPIIFGSSRVYWQDFPLTAMVSLSIYLLIRTDCFKDRKYSLLFGVSAGLGMLTKWTYFVFLSGPFFYFIISAFRDKTEDDKKRDKSKLNAIISILVGIVVASFWYIPNGLDIAGKLFGLSVGITGETGENVTRFQQLGETIGPSGIFNIKSFTYYAGQLVSHQITFFFAILLTIFTFFFLKRRDKKMIWTLLLWIVVSVVAFTLIKNKTMRNTIPMLPAIALIIASGIIEIEKKGLRIGICVIVVIVGFSQYMFTSYGASYLPERISIKIPIGEVIFFQQHENYSYALYKAKTVDWKADEILNVIASTSGEKKNVKIVLMPRDAFSWMAFEYSSYLKGMPFTFIGAVDAPKSVLDSDYVLIKEGGFVVPWFLMDNIQRAYELIQNNIEDFTLIESVVLPEDNNFLSIYNIKATIRNRKSGLIFSNMLQVVEYFVSEAIQGADKKFTVELTLKILKEMDGELMMVFNLLNKKMEVLTKKPITPLASISGWRGGELKTIKASLIVPADVAKDVFSLEIGFYDSSKRKYLTYRPRYLIYKRIGSQ